ncbi:cysteine desulfurase [Citrobacter koseri]|uniref:cysteine desulfurase n=2 Tax=Enterobacteriaceae TaxID=543 RepID=A0A2X2VGQ1_CITKO|nr:cysteine desulfurase [Citrobacter koseri]
MHVNNETGSIQPLDEVCQLLTGHAAYLHVDAAQSFGKYSFGLENTRIDFISVSGHKLYAPKGIGALIARRRNFIKPPLTAIYFGGGQEKGLRPGTLATPLIAGLGLACELANINSDKWIKHVTTLKNEFINNLKEFGAIVNGSHTSPYVLNFSIPGINSEAAMVQLKGIIAVSNGSACTSSSYNPSHVLVAMGLNGERIDGSIRVSFGANTQNIPYQDIRKKLKALL